MRRLCYCLKIRVTLTCFIVFLIPLVSPADSLHALTASYGQPYHGRLINGIPFPSQFQGYQLREEERVQTTPEVIGAMLDAFETVRSQHPGTCDLYLGDFSLTNGGPINHHRSHQNGRDVDVGMYAKGNRSLDSFMLMTEDNFDAAKNWSLVEGILRSQRVQYIFVDRRLQRLLYDYAASRGVDEAYLDRLFGNGRGGVIQHVGNHQDHMHVRFFTPWSTLAAHVGEHEEQKRAVIEMAQQSYLPKKVHYYAMGTERSLETLAKSFGVCGRDLCRWNNLRGNEVLNPGSCVVFYKRGFEIEPVHLAQSLQPVPLVTSPSPVRVASLPPSRTSVSDVGVTLRDSSREKKTEAPSVTTYTVKRGDTLDKVARRSGMDVATLCELNGLKKASALRPGKKIKVSSSKTGALASSGADLPASVGHKASIGKAVQATAVLDPRKSKAPSLIAYKVEKGDTLPKIAKRCGMSVDMLCEINGLRKSASVKPGQMLQLAMNEPTSRTDALVTSKSSQTTGRDQPASHTASARPQSLTKATGACPVPAPGATPSAKSSARDDHGSCAVRYNQQAKTSTTASAASAVASAKAAPTSGPAKVASASKTPSPSKSDAEPKSGAAAKSTSKAKSTSSTQTAQKSQAATKGKDSKSSQSQPSAKAKGQAKNVKQARK